MKRRLVISGAIAAIVLGAAVVPTAHATLSATVEPCQEAIAKSSLKFATKKLKAIQKCNEKNMKTPGDCPAPDLAASIASLQTKLNDGLAKKCGPPFNPLGLSNPNPGGLGFPAKCPQGTPGNFNIGNLDACMFQSHEDAVDALITNEWGSTTANPDSAVQKCQKEIDKDGGKVFSTVLKSVQKCRNAINKGGIGVPANCATADPKTSDKITKAESKALVGITGKCQDAQIAALDVCNGATTVAVAAPCVILSHHLAADDPSPTSGDLIDFEYAAPAACGDGVKNAPLEECDGSDDLACPGNCGVSTGPFACLCLDIPRERVIEHSNSDLDNGWRGDSHDSGVVEGGGYVVNLYDCDSTDTCGDDTCTVGATCSGAPHSPCTTDAQCVFVGQGPTCRTDRTDVGPHCIQNVQVVCSSNADCPGTGNFCLKTFHGPPLPLSAGGISVCVLNIFSENVVGTKNVGLGSGAVRLRQKSVTHLTGLASMPCPVCGGWCAAPADINQGPGQRHTCTTNADCADVGPAHRCVTDSVCNFGPNTDKSCRPNPPFGGSTILFGNPSVDCPPNPTADISGGGLDILFNPATTGTVNVKPTVQCDESAFTGKTCAGGTDNGADCTVDSECPGATCNFQCYCPNGGAIHQRPNGCDAACVGGGSDSFPCNDDSDCTGGFCHLGDCRPDPGAISVLQPNEGACTATVEGHCSVSAFRTCGANSDCQSPACTTCQPGETCNITGKNCFINSGPNPGGLTRSGLADPTNPISASIFCIAQTNTGSVDGTAGLPGPGALIQPETTVDTGLTVCP